jgi:hypothetical protein
MSWWASELNPAGLSQGDVVFSVLLGSVHQPVAYLGRNVFQAKGKTHWPQTHDMELYKTDSTGLFVSRGRVCNVVVLSHSCEIDKKLDSKKVRVVVAPIAPIDGISDPVARESILRSRRWALFPLPEIPGLGTYYADFRQIASVARDLLLEENRIASMTPDSEALLRARLIGYFTRIEPNQIAEAPT